MRSSLILEKPGSRGKRPLSDTAAGAPSAAWRRLADRLATAVLRMPSFRLGAAITLAGVVMGCIVGGTIMFAVFGRVYPGFVAVIAATALLVAPPLAGLLILAIRRQRATAQDLREREEQLRLVTDALPIPVAMTAWQDGRIAFANAAFEELYGIPKGKGAGSYTTSSYADPSCREGYLRALEEGGGSLHRHELEVVRRDGTRFTILSSAQRIRHKGEDVILAALEDVTERRALETALQENQRIAAQATRMQAVGVLAGGMAHELNNAILPIVMMSEDLVDDLAADPAAAQAASSILQAAQRAAAIVSQVLAFSETEVPEATVHDLAAPAGEAVAFLRSTLPASIAIESDVDLLAGASAIAPAALKQVIVNLAINARQAMQGRGTLRIALKPETVVQPRASHGMRLYPGRFARLRVSDDGAGMPAQVRERIFEPFYTTRPVGEGAGLGLSVVHGLVTQHDGAIFVDSEPGRGTQVDVYLPLVNDSDFKREVNGHDEHPAGG